MRKDKKDQRDKEDTRKEEKMYDQIVRLFNAARQQLITLALLRTARFCSLPALELNYGAHLITENFEAATKREARGTEKKVAATGGEAGGEWWSGRQAAWRK